MLLNAGVFVPPELGNFLNRSPIARHEFRPTPICVIWPNLCDIFPFHCH